MLSRCVLDASCVAPWLFKDEASAGAQAMLVHVTHNGAVVPALWHTEIANLIGMGERRKRLEQGDMPVVLGLLRALSLETEAVIPAGGVENLLHLMRTYRLTAYDATYLELALRRGLPLASNDRDLCSAAALCGVALLGPGVPLPPASG